MKIRKLLGLLLSVMLAAGMPACAEPPDDGEEDTDMSRFPLYIEDYESLTYSFGDSNIAEPYFLGNVIYNETVMLVDNGTEISGKLQFGALKVLSVRDHTWETEYAETVDYTVSGNKIVRTANSAMPYLSAENLVGDNVPAPYRKAASISKTATDFVAMGPTIYTESSLIYGHQIHVSYVYDVKELPEDVYPEYDGAALPKFTAKLKAGDPVSMAIIGSSSAEGCSSSGFFKHPPFMDNYMTLAKKGLEAEYGSTITLTNLAKGGTQSSWGTAQISRIADAAPDILFIQFGTNDASNGMSKNMYKDNIELMILDVRSRLPDCEFVLLDMLSPHPEVYDLQRLEQYWGALDELAATHGGVKVVKTYPAGQEMLKTKKYMDITGNGINHPNDFTTRLYAMSILATFVGY